VNARALGDQDIPQLAKWNVQLHEDEGSTPMSVEAATERIRRWLDANTFQGAVFVVDEKAVGYLLYEHRPVHADLRASESVYVRQFFISRESRRRGHGTKAFETFLRELVPERANVILDVKTSNGPGQRFWETLGFAAKSIAYELDRSPIA
jgi:ribosomal protein S18 acetylase RimI-like enzyme